MSDDPFHEAVEALRAIGWKVEPTGDDLSLWLADSHECTEGELIALARLFGFLRSKRWRSLQAFCVGIAPGRLAGSIRSALRFACGGTASGARSARSRMS